MTSCTSFKVTLDYEKRERKVGPLITFEGPEGSGKSTQMQLLAEYLRERGYSVLTTREPGGTSVGEQIRDVLLSPENQEIFPLTEVLLYSASRAQHVEQVIRPYLEGGCIVLCDRYADSTLAYQGYGHGLDLAMLRTITEFATNGLKPDLTIYLDLPVEIGLRRRLGLRGEQPLSEARIQLPLFEKWDRFDTKELEFHRRVRAGYQELAAAEPERWLVIDATRPVEEIQRIIRGKVEERLGKVAT